MKDLGKMTMTSRAALALAASESYDNGGPLIAPMRPAESFPAAVRRTDPSQSSANSQTS